MQSYAETNLEIFQVVDFLNKLHKEGVPPQNILIGHMGFYIYYFHTHEIS